VLETKRAEPTTSEARAPKGPSAGLRDLIEVYGDTSLAFRAFLAHRWWHASMSAVERAVPATGTVLDLGCGDGIFANLVGLRGPGRRVIGLEKNERKAVRGRGRIANVEISARDITETSFPTFDAVTIIDVLHHLDSYAEQETLLDVVTDVLPSGGTLVLKDVSRAWWLKWRATTVLDHIAYPGDTFYFRHHDEFRDLLERRGFDVEFVDLSRRVPYAHMMFVARKRARS
jgi:SAM-dependent methyltransferase